MRTSKIRVLVPYMLAYYGGVRRLLGDGLPYLQRISDIEIDYAELCLNEGDMADMEADGVCVNRELGVAGNGVLSHRLGFRRLFDLLAAVPRMVRIILRLQRSMGNYDLIYLHGYRELLLASVAVLMGSRKPRPPIFWHCHGIGDESLPPFLAFLAKRCLRVIAISRDTASRLGEIGVDPCRIEVVHNAIDAGKIRKLSEEPGSSLLVKRPGETVILVPSASIRMAKGLHIAVDSLAYLPKNCCLWLTGDPEDPSAIKYRTDLEKVISESGLLDRVRFIGNRSDIYSVMKQSDIIIVPSLCREAFGLSVVEAMALGKPVIVSMRGALPEVIGSPENGWMFDHDDSTLLADCIRAVIADPEEARRRAANGKDRVDHLFHFERWAAEVADVLRHCVSVADERSA